MAVNFRMTKRERLDAALFGKPLDRPPYGFWGHHFCAEYSLYSHVSSTLWWQRSFDMDFIKVQARASHQVEDWGVRMAYESSLPSVGFDPGYQPKHPPARKPKLVDYPVKKPDDWKDLQVLDPQVGSLGERLAALRTIKHEVNKLNDDRPVIVETIFNPITIAGQLLGWGGEHYDKLDLLRTHLHAYPELLQSAMQVFTQSIIAYVQACKQAGIKGFFFATTQWGTYNRLTQEEYNNFARPYDLQVLKALGDSTLLIFHVCKTNNMLLDLADYPVQVFNWGDTEDGNPSISEFREKYPHKTILGGISRESLTAPLPESAVNEARGNLEFTGGERWIAAPDCSIPPDAPPANIRAVVDYLRK